MTSALQNRLVGTIIIVAIAVIFLPDLLDGKKQVPQNSFIDLPPKPVAYEVENPSNVDLDKIKEVATRKVEIVSEKAADEATQTEAAEVEKNITLISDTKQDVVVKDTAVAKPDIIKTSSKSSLEKHTVVEQSNDTSEVSAGWVVQLGSFRHKKNVNELLNVLDEAGYRAFSRPVKTSSGILTKVFVGPDLRKSNLEEALSHLKELTKLQGRVTPFTVQ